MKNMDYDWGIPHLPCHHGKTPESLARKMTTQLMFKSLELDSPRLQTCTHLRIFLNCFQWKAGAHLCRTTNEKNEIEIVAHKIVYINVFKLYIRIIHNSSSDSRSWYRGLYRGFLKWGYPQIIHFNGIFHYKPASYWGIPINGNHHMEDSPIQICLSQLFWLHAVRMFCYCCESQPEVTVEVHSSPVLDEAGGRCFRVHSVKFTFQEVSWHGGTPKSSIFTRLSTMNHPFWGYLHLWTPSCSHENMTDRALLIYPHLPS